MNQGCKRADKVRVGFGPELETWFEAQTGYEKARKLSYVVKHIQQMLLLFFKYL